MHFGFSKKRSLLVRLYNKIQLQKRNLNQAVYVACYAMSFPALPVAASHFV